MADEPLRPTLDPARDVDRAVLERLEVAVGRPLGEVRRDDELAGFGLDELDRAHLAYFLEQKFGARIDPGLGPGPRTVGDLVGPIEQKLFWTYPPPPSQGAVDLVRSDFFPRLWRLPLHVLFRGLIRLAFRYRAFGRAAVPRRGPFVLVANHAGHPDAPALLSALPLRRVNNTHPLAAQDYFWKRPVLGSVVHGLLNAVPIDRHASADRAMKAALDLLGEGHGLILFPEGTRSASGEIAPFKKGVGLLLAGKPYPAIPAFIEGSRDVLPKGKTWPRFRRLRVRLGEPANYAEETDDREGWKRVAADLEARVRALAPASPAAGPNPNP